MSVLPPDAALGLGIAFAGRHDPLDRGLLAGFGLLCAATAALAAWGAWARTPNRAG